MSAVVRGRDQSPRSSPVAGTSYDYISTLVFSPDGHTLASGSGDETIRLWDVRTHNRIGQPFAECGVTADSVAFSPDGVTLASGNMDDSVRLWDVRTHNPIGPPLAGHDDRVRSIAFSPDGRTLVSGSEDRTVRVWRNVLWRTFGELQAKAASSSAVA